MSKKNKVIDKTFDTYMHSLQALNVRQKELDNDRKKLNEEYKDILEKIDFRRA